jgi:hypothetical protein
MTRFSFTYAAFICHVLGFHLSTAAQSTAGTSPSALPANASNTSAAKRSSLLSDVTIDMVAANNSSGKQGRAGNKGFSRIARLVGSGSGTFNLNAEDKVADLE